LAESAEFLKHFDDDASDDDASKGMLAEGAHGSIDVQMMPPEKVAAEIARLP